MVNVYGQTENYLLFTDDVNAVVIDKSTNMIDEVGSIALLSSLQPWSQTDEEVHSVYFELADGALADLRVHAVVASGRMYTIPKGAQAEAKKALEWHKEFGRGGTPVGMNTARTLAAGGQIGLQKVKHIAKYFPRHEVDKKGKGYKPGQDGFPSNGRIAWALWGGDTAWRWARAIVEQENNKAVRADGYMLSQDGSTYEDYRMATDYDADVNAFQQAHELGDEFGPEFVARVRLDGSGIDRLYKIDLEGGVAVWDGNSWDNLGHVDSDIMTYDKSLDDPYDTVEKSHIVLDPDSALVLSAHLQQDPFKSVTVYDLDPEEASIVEAAADEMDWTIVDSSIIAAGEAPDSAAKDGNYTPEERSQKARKQVRDKGGKFAAMGSRVVVSGSEGVSAQGNITRINPDSQTVTVKLDSGESVDVPAVATQSVDDAEPVNTQIPGTVPALDLAGILGQPRTPIDRPNARIPGTLPALTSTDIQNTLYDYPPYVKSAREQQISDKVDAESAAYAKKREKETGVKFTGLDKDLRQHPLWKDLFAKRPELGLYYNPLTLRGSGEAPVADAPEKKTIGELAKEHTGIGEEVNPDTSDVQPMYLAIVSPDDPKAVFDLVSIVPAGTKSNAPMTFKRVNATWQKDETILSDLSSATPPPVVPLHGDALVDVINQIDGTIAASAFSEFAQGGLDKNRGGAEKLRRYWVYGKGAAKIRWGTPGDWSRCVRHLGKYMGPRAKGYCNLRHKDALHIYPATHAKILRGGRAKHNSNDEFIMEEPLYDIFDGGDQKHKFTEVTYADMAMELEEISSLEDSNFDHEFEPDDDIVTLLRDINATELELAPIIAEGGLDRNRGNAERLRHYWVYGKGAVKIRWNTPGDWTRCYHHLMKYMGPRAKGYCSLRHKEATGFWPGSKYNVGKKNTRLASAGYTDTYLLDEETVLNSLILKAQANAARERVLLAGGHMNSEGSKFTIPLVIPEDTESGDGRKFKKEAITMRELPLPLLWQIKTADGHDGAVVVGRIDSMERTENGIGNAHGVFDSGAYGQEAERMVREGFMRGVSADLDQFEASEETSEDAAEDTDHKIGGQKIIITSARVMAVTIVPKPAFEECKIYLEDTADTSQQQEEEVLQDGDYVGDVAESDAQSLVACGMVASSIPTVPPAEWFSNPKLNGPTPLTVDDDGRVFGHIAAWHVDHIGMSYGTRPPRSKSKYSYFHTGVVRAEDGKDYPVGQLTLAGGHASLEASAIDAARHYDDTGSAIADVHAGEDQFGIWVSGGLRPSASPEQIRALRASAPSGDWRPIKGHLELVAVCQVNVPGFPIARARVASGQVYALVAAGAQVLARMKADPIADLEARLARMEFAARPELAAQAEDAKARISGFVTQRNAELASRAEEVSRRFRDGVDYESFAYVSRGARKKLAEEGKALPDGSFPIRNEDDLKNAIQAYGRAKPGKKASVRRHIMKRARGLEKADLIPEAWKSASAIEEDVTDLRAYVASIEAQLRDAAEQSNATAGYTNCKSCDVACVCAAGSCVCTPECTCGCRDGQN